MASEIADHDQNASPSVHDDGNGALGAGDVNRGTKRPRPAADDDDDDDDKPGRERRKIEIKFIQDKSRRHITFSKRKAGIMKKVRRVCAHCIPVLPQSYNIPPRLARNTRRA
jgi:pheromone receptor transcription factor